jgi:CobQ-like glutamine amidotransferase family enzyme
MNQDPRTKNLSLTIGWLYPELMSTYGDRGNITVLTKRCEWRGIDVTILPIDQSTVNSELRTVNLLFGGGSQDREQEIVMKDLQNKAKSIKELIEHNIPSLFVCGSPQLMGKFYEPSDGKRIEGVGVFDMETVHPGPNAPRLIGNTVARVNWENLTTNYQLLTTNSLIVGFENHGGRTKLDPNSKPFASVIKGFGNNGEDGTEGVVYKNAIGCYFHGPLLPKNPSIADFLIRKALEVKYEEDIHLEPLDDSLEMRAHDAILKKLGVMNE